MKDRRRFKRTPVLVATLVVALLLLVGVYTVIAASPAEPDPDLSSISGSAIAWSSPWTLINQGETLTFTHNLGGDPNTYTVELWFLDTDGGRGINRCYYGGLEDSGNWYGAHWQNLTANTIQVYRQPNDTVADRVRVRVWIPDATPDYDSGWRNLATGATYFYHGLTVTPTDLSVAVWFSGTLHGIHHFSYGGLTDGTFQRGAYWWMTGNAVVVYRRPDDANVEQARVVVVHGAPPDYDSLVALGGWQPITPSVPFTFTHNLNWNPNMLLVRGECRDSAVGAAEFHQMWAGGDEWAGGLFRGAHLQNLTANSIQFVRQANDVECDQARVVIYRRSVQVYLPIVLKSYSSP